jgi:hypothetical protein
MSVHGIERCGPGWAAGIVYADFITVAKIDKRATIGNRTNYY